MSGPDTPHDNGHQDEGDVSQRDTEKIPAVSPYDPYNAPTDPNLKIPLGYEQESYPDLRTPNIWPDGVTPDSPTQPGIGERDTLKQPVVQPGRQWQRGERGEFPAIDPDARNPEDVDESILDDMHDEQRNLPTYPLNPDTDK